MEEYQKVIFDKLKQTENTSECFLYAEVIQEYKNQHSPFLLTFKVEMQISIRNTRHLQRDGKTQIC